ncbi:MAG: hypothetical protein JKY54_17025 [Flavobacteriales bacterium]|nr:hypothetical protein [Flavobacteriales bacterium]
MLKSALILVNVIGLVVFPFLNAENVSINHDFPTEINAGEEKVVIITLNKGAISGPARLKLDFTNATGLEASEIESHGASFTFKDNSVLFIWYSIPADETITLKYKLKASADANGPQTVSGTSSYVDGGAREKMPIPSAIVEVNGNGTVSTDPDPVDPDPIDPDVVVIDSSVDSIPPPPEVTTSRTVEADGDGFIVTVTINKENGKGFARLKEIIPNGFTAKGVQASGAVFTASSGTAKFLWSSIDVDTPVTVKYRLSPNPGTASGSYSITGGFSAEFMVVDDVTKTANVDMSSFDYQGEVAGIDPDPVDPDPVDPDPVDPDPVDPDPVVNTGVEFKVQIMACHKNVNQAYFKKRYGVTDRVATEAHEGWIKYTVGGYDKYKKARDKREQLSPLDLPHPFVSSYNAGERISVQEALMVTSQDWIK